MLKYIKTLNKGRFDIHAVDHCNQSCLFCNNNSPFCDPKQYDASDYIPWIDILCQKDIKFDTIGIIGGEPFLHTDLFGFVSAIKTKYHNKKIALMSNGFWLGQVEKFENIFPLLSRLSITLYPKQSVKVDKDVDAVLAKSPKLTLLKRDETPFYELNEYTNTALNNQKLTVVIKKLSCFYKIEFSSTGVCPNKVCRHSKCSLLKSDGTLWRCAVAAYANLNPGVSKEFLKFREDLCYDLSGTRNFQEWTTKWPFDACKYCSVWKSEKSSWRETKC
jgi:organic radical activating enzyme